MLWNTDCERKFPTTTVSSVGLLKLATVVILFYSLIAMEGSELIMSLGITLNLGR